MYNQNLIEELSKSPTIKKTLGTTRPDRVGWGIFVFSNRLPNGFVEASLSEIRPLSRKITSEYAVDNLNGINDILELSKAPFFLAPSDKHDMQLYEQTYDIDLNGEDFKNLREFFYGFRKNLGSYSTGIHTWHDEKDVTELINEHIFQWCLLPEYESMLNLGFIKQPNRLILPKGV